MVTALCNTLIVRGGSHAWFLETLGPTDLHFLLALQVLPLHKVFPGLRLLQSTRVRPIRKHHVILTQCLLHYIRFSLKSGHE